MRSGLRHGKYSRITFLVAVFRLFYHEDIRNVWVSLPILSVNFHATHVTLAKYYYEILTPAYWHIKKLKQDVGEKPITTPYITFTFTLLIVECPGQVKK